MFSWTTYADLAKDLYQFAGNLPPEIGLIIGIARSGMIPAGMLSTHLNIPLAEAETFLKGDKQLCGAGGRLNKNPQWEADSMALLLEDTTRGGQNLFEYHAKIIKLYPEIQGRIFTGTIYACPESVSTLHFHGRVITSPRLFEWNWINQGEMKTTAWDIDGALCFNPDVRDDDDARYSFWVRNARPLFLPRRFEIPLIVTNRLERFRGATEDWLTRHGLRWKQLIMNPARTGEERATQDGFPVALKAAAYKADPSLSLFVESERNDAIRIWQESGKPTFCSSTMEFFQ